MRQTAGQATLMRGSECWTIKKVHEQKMKVADKNVKCTGSIAMLDRIQIWYRNKIKSMSL